MKAYVISQADAYSWSSTLEITHVTLDREKAKKILYDIIYNAREEAELNGYEYDKSLTKEEIEEYVETLTDSGRDEYSCCSDYCDWIDVWCEIVEVE